MVMFSFRHTILLEFLDMKYDVELCIDLSVLEKIRLKFTTFITLKFFYMMTKLILNNFLKF